uniref:Uncharacterized protein n=1 Tax=Tetranychus urticae TaxID=32264 RepID=T1JV46_TETUR
MMSPFQLTLLLFCFTLYPSYSVGDPDSIISFNVYRNGTKTYGHFKVPSMQIKSDFFLHQRNETHMQFDIFSKEPHHFAISSNLAVTQEAGVMNFKGQIKDFARGLAPVVNFDTNISMVEGHKLESKIDFNIPNTINGTYLFNLSARPDQNACFPLKFAHNLTTYPPGLIDYNSGIKGTCGSNGDTNVDLDVSLKSNEWSWLNTNLKQFWFFNSNGGYESMNATNSAYDIDVVANWTNAPHVKKFKMASFRSKTNQYPSFRIKYLVDGEDKKMLYEKI